MTTQQLLLCTLLTTSLAQSQAPPTTPKARVFIYQTKLRTTRANPIFCDGLQVASLRHRWSYFVLQVDAGEHVFRGRHKENEIVIDLSPGHDYFLRVDQLTNGWIPYEKLVRETTEQGHLMATSGKLHPIEPGDVNDQSKVSLVFADSSTR
jgi:hypothetical protein